MTELAPHTTLNSKIIGGRFIFLAAVLTLAGIHSARGQGCVVAHGSGMPTTFLTGAATNPWEMSVSYRWFKSDRHYVGTEEQPQRQAEGSQVINRSNFTDVALNYTITPRYSVTVTIPYVSHDRSSVVRDSNRVILQRYSTQSSGLADASIVANAWVFDPVASHQGNLQLGLGVALPTGKDDVTDVFQTYDRATGKILGVTRTVDQSIQPGSGGYGFILNTYGYRSLGSGFTAFGNASYTITPQTKNGVPTYRSNVFESIMSIPDTYVARAGVEYAISDSRVTLSLGGRIEGVPVRDLVGGSSGFRRPGYSIAVEPGVGVSGAKWSARLYVPVAVRRNRQQSVPDKYTTAATGTYSQGDAAFADYLIMTNVTYRF